MTEDYREEGRRRRDTCSSAGKLGIHKELATCSLLMALAKEISLEVIRLEHYRLLTKLKQEVQLDGRNKMAQRTRIFPSRWKIHGLDGQC